LNLSANSYDTDPIEIDTGIYWVGYSNDFSKLHCNPYLIVEADEAVLIDGGNRDDFSHVMLKILRTGIKPDQIIRLIYQHYDPDLCGSLPQMEAIINRSDLKIISHSENNVLIRYYSAKTEMLDFRDLGHHFDFKTGRRLEFYATPFCHQPGSFVTLDRQTGTLFSSDLFGSFDDQWSLFLELSDSCRQCSDINTCPIHLPVCPMKGIIQFHQRVMTSNKAAAWTMQMIDSLDIDRIAPQHGSIINSKKDIRSIIHHLQSVQAVGIDFYLDEVSR